MLNLLNSLPTSFGNFPRIYFFCLFFLFRFISTTKQLTKGQPTKRKQQCMMVCCVLVFKMLFLYFLDFSRFAMKCLLPSPFSMHVVKQCGSVKMWQFFLFIHFSLIFTIHVCECVSFVYMFVFMYVCKSVSACICHFNVMIVFLFSMGKSKITKNKNDSIQVCECVFMCGCLLRFF